MSTTEFDFSTLDMPTEVSFDPVPAGTYTGRITEVDVTTSKASGYPMLVVSWALDHEGAEHVIREYSVLAYIDKKTGQTRMGFSFPRYADAAGVNLSSPAAKKKALGPGKVDATLAKISSALVGVTANVTVDAKPNVYLTSEGEEVETIRNNVKRFVVTAASASESTEDIVL